MHTAQSADNEKRFMCWCTNKIILKAAYKRCLLLLCYHALGGSAGPAKMPEAHWQGHFLLGPASALEENQQILTSLAVNWHKTQIWEHNRQLWHRASFLLGFLDLLHTRGLMPCAYYLLHTRGLMPWMVCYDTICKKWMPISKVKTFCFQKANFAIT